MLIAAAALLGGSLLRLLLHWVGASPQALLGAQLAGLELLALWEPPPPYAQAKGSMSGSTCSAHALAPLVPALLC